MQKTFHVLHRKIAPILLLPLLITALTGMASRVGESWLGLPHAGSELLMAFHEGRYLGQALVPVYVLLLGLGLIGLVITGLVMVWRRPLKLEGKKDWRWLHRILAILGFLPLLLSAVTGMAFRLGLAWFNLPIDKANYLKSIHQGGFLGHTLKPVYVLMVGIGLLALLYSGFEMMGFFRKRKSSAA